MRFAMIRLTRTTYDCMILENTWIDEAQLYSLRMAQQSSVAPLILQAAHTRTKKP